MSREGTKEVKKKNTVQGIQVEVKDQENGQGMVAQPGANGPLVYSKRSEKIRKLKEDLLELQKQETVQKEEAEKLQEPQKILTDQLAEKQELMDKEKDPEKKEAYKGQVEELKEVLDNFNKEEQKLLRIRLEKCEKEREIMKENILLSGTEIDEAIQDEIDEFYLKNYVEALEDYQKIILHRHMKMNRRIYDMRDEYDRTRRRVKERKCIEQTARNVAKQIKEFRKSGYKEALKSLDDGALVDTCIACAETLKKQSDYLEPSYVTAHISQSLSVIDMLELLESRYEKIRKNPSLKSKRKECEKARALLEYYKEHIDTVIGDCGISLEDSSYDEKHMKLRNSVKQAERWSQDYKKYQSIYLDMGEAKAEETSKSRMEQLEDIAGVSAIVEDDASLEATIYDDTKTEKALKEDFLDKNTEGEYFRYQQNIIGQTKDLRQRSNFNLRLYAVSTSFVNELMQEKSIKEKLKTDKDFEKNWDFAKLPGLFKEFAYYYEDHSESPYYQYLYEEHLLRRQITNLLQDIEMNPKSSFREKQYAYLISKYLIEDQSGDLEVSTKGKYYFFSAEDSDYTDIRDNVKITDKVSLDYKFYSVKNWPIFEGSPTVKDIHQGAVGDCYFMSALASVVSRDPKIIKDMMKDNMDGTVTVRFYKKDPDDGTLSSVYVTVDKSVPVYFLDELRLETCCRGALWVKLLEKAYAVVNVSLDQQDKFTNGKNTKVKKNKKVEYESLRSGHYYDAIEQITGVETTTYYGDVLKDMTDDDLFDRINRVLKNGGICGVGTVDFKAEESKKDGKSGERSKAGMLGRHAYSVLGTEIYEINGEKKKFLRMHNPHAENVPIYKFDDKNLVRISAVEGKAGKNYDGLSNGVFLIEWEEARKLINGICFVDKLRASN